MGGKTVNNNNNNNNNYTQKCVSAQNRLQWQHTAQHNTAQQHNTTQHSTAQHSTTHHSTTQHSTTQHNTPHVSILTLHKNAEFNKVDNPLHWVSPSNPSQPSDAMWRHTFHLSLICMSFAQ
jgi:hypothetical protein